MVTDTAAALTDMGALARARLAGGTIGITGSVGKTTTKDLTAHCLAASFPITASARSLNNELGVPLTLCNAPEEAAWVVLEMGSRGIGHIETLTQLARPRVGIVTSVAMAHIEFFGDLEGVFTAKSELVRALPDDGLAVLNADDERVARMAELAPCPVLTYGVAQGADVMAEAVELGADLRARFRLVSPWGTGEVSLRLFGLPQVSNALAAATAALWCGVPFDAVRAALTEVESADLRMDVRHPVRGPALIIDCYNANPLSTEAALHSLAQLGHGHKLALLGKMAELGPETEEQHRRLTEVARRLGVEVRGYQTDLYGGAPITSVSEAVALVSALGADDAALFKASRAVQLEQVVRAYGESIGDPTLAS